MWLAIYFVPGIGLATNRVKATYMALFVKEVVAMVGNICAPHWALCPVYFILVESNLYLLKYIRKMTTFSISEEFYCLNCYLFKLP